MNDVNACLKIDPSQIMPLVGFDDLPVGFRFRINLYKFGRCRCFVIVTAPCLSDCLEALGVGQCPLTIHEAIYQQLHIQQVGLDWADADDLPALLGVFARYECYWWNFDQ